MPLKVLKNQNLSLTSLKTVTCIQVQKHHTLLYLAQHLRDNLGCKQFRGHKFTYLLNYLLTFSLLHTILVVIALNSWYHLLEAMHSVTVTFLPQLCLGMAYQHTSSNHHQLNASNLGWQNFTLHLQVPSLLIIVFISHSHTLLIHLQLHTVLYFHRKVCTI